MGEIGPENQNCLFKLKFGTYINSNMQNSVVRFILFALDLNGDVHFFHFPPGNTLFGQIWCKKIKIVSLSWNLVLRLIPISNFGVSTTVLNPVDNSCRWCKLNFEPMPDQVKLRHFSEKTGVRRQYFHIFKKFLGIIS